MSWNTMPRSTARRSTTTYGTATLERPLPAQRRRPAISGPQPAATEMFGPPGTPVKTPPRTRSQRRRNRRKRRALVQIFAVIIAALAACSYFLVSGNNDVTSASHTVIQTGNEQAPQFITRAKAKGYAQPRHTAKTHRGKPKPSVSATASASPGSSGVAAAPGFQSGTTPVGSGASSRSVYDWPFAWNSIWNIPIASTASYAAANLRSQASYEDETTEDFDSIDPSAPLKSLTNAQLSSGGTGPVSVHVDPSMSADGQWNTCSAFLGSDNATVYQGQTTELTAGGNPTFGGVADNTWKPESITGDGIAGCQGGSGLSGLGGSLTLSDLTQSGPITHALKIALDGVINYSSANGGYRWPALNADAGYNDPGSGNYYGGSNPNVQQGSLLALPRSISPSSFSNPTVAKLAQAAQDYGIYIVDTTATGSTFDYSSIITNYNASAKFQSDLCSGGTKCAAVSSRKTVIATQLESLIQDLDVITNNTPSTPGGGAIGASRCAPYAPAFSDGSGAPPSVSVAGC